VGIHTSCRRLPAASVDGFGEIMHALRRLGWRVFAQRGSHVQLRHRERSGRVTVPLHAGETIGPGLLRAILAQAGITADELRSAL
jgi:predicted RNA binding protein YcfA (HicA-like mRNA interferase family)